jgi:hypothetical protein
VHTNAAVASYAKQSEDERVFHYATRVKARAIRRGGKMLEEIEPAQGARTDLGRAPTRSSAAEAAGVSEHQRKTMLRVANVPQEDFDRQVESDSPPTITALAEQGKKAVHLGVLLFIHRQRQPVLLELFPLSFAGIPGNLKATLRAQA